MALVLLISIAAVVIVNEVSFTSDRLPFETEMRQASVLCAKWFESIERLKTSQQIVSDSRSTTHYNALIGDDFTSTTTTLGSLEAKETAANPDFAALVVRWLKEAGIDSTSTVGVVLSGSFPTLSIAALAAVQTVGAKAIVFSSLGASAYGANQPGATWIDMEKWLADNAGLKYRSMIVSLGGENDNGGGMLDEGVLLLKQAAVRCNVTVYHPGSLQESILAKTNLLVKEHVSLVINIGGNQAAMGRCGHELSIPNGYHEHWSGCQDEERGLLVRLAERNIPIVHLLNIKDLAARFGLPVAPGNQIPESTDLYFDRVANPIGPAVGLAAICAALLGVRVRANRTLRAQSTHPAVANKKTFGHEE